MRLSTTLFLLKMHLHFEDSGGRERHHPYIIDSVGLYFTFELLHGRRGCSEYSSIIKDLETFLFLYRFSLFGPHVDLYPSLD